MLRNPDMEFLNWKQILSEVQFDLLDIILILGVSQGIFLALSLRLLPNRNKEANGILSVLLLISVFMLLGRMAVLRIPLAWVWRFGILADTTIFLFGPLVYTYVRRMLFAEQPAFRLRWVHYLPALAHLGYYFWGLGFSLAEFNERYFSGQFNLMFFIVEAGGLISFILYTLFSMRLLNRFKKLEEKAMSFRQTVRRYLWMFMATLGIFILLWLISFISLYFFRTQIGVLNYTTMWVSTPIFIYVIGYFSLKQPAIFRIRQSPKTKSESDRLKPDEIQQLQKRLHYFMETEKVYLKPDLTLQELASKMNTSPNNLSWLLNQIHQSTFYDYINAFRIDAFLEKIKNNRHASHTLLALAMEAGFNSKSTFNRVFKSRLGVTPSQYLKSKNVA